VTPVRWSAGDAATRRLLDRALDGGAGPDPPVLLEEKAGRRRHLRVRADGAVLLVKHIRVGTARHRWRETAKAALGLGAAEREWRALRRLRAAGVPAPEPVALGRTADGDRLLVLRHLPGRPLDAALRACRAERRPLLVATGALVARLHAAGLVHRDLHAGNVRVTDRGPVLTDVGRVGRSRQARARRRDLACLDHSLEGLASRGDRVRVACAALGLSRPLDAEARRALRRAARASRRRARSRARSRVSRSLRPGRRFAHARTGAWRGLRLRAFAEAELAAALAAHARRDRPGGARTVKESGRSVVTRARLPVRDVVVKEVPARGPWRAARDGLRGSPARRAWRAGHGLQARGLPAATPLAFLERRRLGLPAASLVVLEALPEAAAAHALARPPEETLAALTRALVALHRAAVSHRDLQADHVFLVPAGRGLEARLVDLDDVRFPRRLPDRRRRRALAQLAASLPDAVPDALRARAFAAYARALPFRGGREGRERALRRVVRESLRRRHRWTAPECGAVLGSTKR